MRLPRLVLALIGVTAFVLVPAATGRAAARHFVQIGRFDAPVYVAATPSEPRAVYVVEQPGRIVRVSGGRSSTFLDIRSQVLSGGEQGLLSVAFHPSFADNRLFYIDYVARNGHTVIAEYRARTAGEPARVRTLVDLPDPASNHNGGQLVFGPDGYLWWGNGDGGGGGDQFGNGQRAEGNFAKIMRLDVAKRGSAWKTWAVGLRNPWRFSFDRASGALYIGDVGQGKYEEIDYVRRGRSHLNFGWNRFEGRARYGSEALLPGWRYVPPIHVYDHGQGCSVTGGYVYRGKSVVSAVGRYFYGDYCSGKVWSLRVANGKAGGNVREPFDVPSLSSFGEDASGELYLTSLDGPVYRLVG